MTGLFREFTILFLIIIIHELGHIKVSSYYGWQIDSISLLPFGGNIKYNKSLNKPIKEELYIVLAGPFYQLLFYLACYLLFINNYLLESTFYIIKNYHYALLVFNLLPIYPLDGSKLLNLLLNKFFSFKTSHLITIYLSLLALFIIFISLIFSNLNLAFYLILFILLTKTYWAWHQHSLIFNKFLLERYLYPLHLLSFKTIAGANLNKMMRDKKHLFLIDNEQVTEKEMLKKRFRDAF